MSEQSLSKSLQHPHFSSVVVWASGSVLCAYDVEDRKFLFQTAHLHKGAILSVSCLKSDKKSSADSSDSGESAYPSTVWVTCGEDKRVVISKESRNFQVTTVTPILTYLHRKKPTGAFLDNNGGLFVCDMFGEGCRVELGSLERLLHESEDDSIEQPGAIEISSTPYVLFGCFSVISCATQYENLLITGDRDEKIRICKFPQVQDIVSFCLGHRSYVSEISIIRGSMLASTGGDGYLRIWNIESGQELAKYKVAESLIPCMTVYREFVFVGIEGSGEIKKFSVDELGQIIPCDSIQMNSVPQSVAVVGDGRFLVSVSDQGDLEISDISIPEKEHKIVHGPTDCGKQARIMLWKFAGKDDDEDPEDQSPSSKQRRYE